MGSRLVVAALGWAGTLLIVRNLAVHAWGEFSFVFSFIAIVSILTDLATSPMVIKGVLADNDPGRFAGIYVLLRAALGLLAYAVAMAFVVLAGYPAEVVRTMAVGGSLLVAASVSNGYDGIFQAVVRMGPVALANIVGQAAQFALIGVLAYIGSSVVVFAIPAVAAQVVILAWKLRAARPILRVRPAFSWLTSVGMLRAALPLAIGGALITVYYNLDSVMLSKLATFTAVGIYGVAYKFAGVVSFLPLAIQAPLLGLLVRSWPHDPAAFWGACRKAFVVMSITAVLILVEFGLFAPQAIHLLYGANFVVGANAARIVVASECLGFFGALAIAILIAIGRNRVYVIAGLAGLVINFSLNLVVIPRYSYQGAAWATMGTEIAVTAVLWGPILRLRDRAHFPVSTAIKAGVCGALAAGAAMLADLVTPWYVAVIGSSLLYVALLHFWRVPGDAGLRSLLRDEEVLPGLPESAAPAGGG
jgi:O-antigen/teichoic acid export membrane protein